MRQWRLIYDKPMIGITNMAIDEAILSAVSDSHAMPTLRLYGWEPLCLSLGYGQRLSDVDLERIHMNHWGIVRRPTGGKAILHGNELTYSVSIPNDHELAQGDVVESYRRISEALLAALHDLHLQPRSEQQPKGNSGLGPVCFEVPSHYEIVVDDKKLIGSAQVRRRNGVLQHGSLPLTGDIALICDALAYPSELEREQARLKVRSRATTLQQVLGYALPWQTVADAIVMGFEQTFGIQFTVQTLSAYELDRVEKLITDAYGNREWLEKR